MVFTQAFTFKVLGLGAAHVAIGPLFFSVVNDHAMLIDAKCPFRNFLNRVNRLDSKEGDLIRGGVTDVDA